MNLIVAVDNNWAIGSKNELLIRIPNDHKHFREETTGKVERIAIRLLNTWSMVTTGTSPLTSSTTCGS